MTDETPPRVPSPRVDGPEGESPEHRALPNTSAAKPLAAETLTPNQRAWLERFTPESWEGFPGYEPEIATAIRQALTAIDAANAEIERLKFLHDLDHKLADQWQARVAALEADRNEIAERAMATKGRLVKLEAALAKAVAALIFYAEDPGEPLRGNGDTARQALAAIRAALAGLPGPSK